MAAASQGKEPQEALKEAAAAAREAGATHLRK